VDVKGVFANFVEKPILAAEMLAIVIELQIDQFLGDRSGFGSFLQEADGVLDLPIALQPGRFTECPQDIAAQFFEILFRARKEIDLHSGWSRSSSANISVFSPDQDPPGDPGKLDATGITLSGSRP
jgi:hypothetical protein